MDINRKVASILNQLGVDRRLSGFALTIAAMNLICEDSNRLTAITRLYSDVAAQMGMTSQQVERNIRNMVEIIWERGNQELLCKMAYGNLKKRPAVGQFLAILASVLERQEDIA